AVEDLRDRRDARPAGHVDIEHEHPWPVRGHSPLGQLDVARLGHDFEVAFGVEQHPQPGAHDLVVVRKHDRDRRPGVTVLAPGTLAGFVLLRHGPDSTTDPGATVVGCGSCSSTAPRTTPPAPNVTSPSTTSRSASRKDGGPAGKRSSKSSSSL